MAKDYIQVPNHIFNKAVSVFKMQRKQRELMKQIDNWLESKGYNVEDMRYHDSFQSLLEHGEFESEEALIETMMNELKKYFPK